jgi:hypothetical protein
MSSILIGIGLYCLFVLVVAGFCGMNDRHDKRLGKM